MQFGNFKILFVLFFFSSLSGFCQSLEDQIYNAVDLFVANPNKNSLEVLNSKEKVFSSKIKTFDEQLALVILYCNKGSFERQNNLQKSAVLSYEKAWTLFDKKKLSNYDIIEYCLKPLGTLYTKSENFTLAENTIKKYLFLAEKTQNNAIIISGYINLSIVYKSIGKYQTAVDLLQKAANNKSASAIQNKRIKEELSVNYIGLKKYENATVLLQQFKDNAYQTLKTKSFLAIQNNNSIEAFSYFKKAKIAFFKKQKISASEVAKLYVDEASLHRFVSDKKEAKKLLIKALHVLLPLENGKEFPDKNSLYPENTFLNIFDGLAEIATNTKQKIEYYNLSFYVSDAIKQDVVSQESLLISQYEDRIRTENCLQILWHEYQKTSNSHWIEMAFSFAEKSKNRVLKNKTNLKTLLQQHPKNSQLIRQNKLAALQETLINKLILLQVTGRNLEEIESINSKLTSVSIDLKTTNQKIQKQFKSNLKDSLTTVDLYKKLKKDDAQLICFFWGKEAVYKFQVSESKIIWNQIKRNKKFTEILRNFIHFFDSPSAINEDVNAFSQTSFRLFENLHLSSLKKDKNTIIIPDGLLNFVAFDGLLTKKTSSANFSKMPFLVFQNKVAYQSSVTSYILNSAKQKVNTIVGFFPVFENTKAELVYSKEEAKALQPFGAKLYMNAFASKANFLKNNSKYSILHLSTHGTSGTFSEPATLVFYDDLMLLNELYAMKNCHPDLVVLSACETGLGKLQKGEGAMSIARAFQYAGADNILFSLWKINDFATSQIMANFYTSFAKNDSFFESNYTSKINYLSDENISNAKKSPYYWSSFVYYGAIDALETNYIYYSLVSLFLIIILFLIYEKGRRHFKERRLRKDKF
jgi:hypothetical protein